MNEWYCRLLGQELGPMSWDELIFLAKKGNLRRDTLVCRGTERVWLPAAQFRGLFADERRERSARVASTTRERPRVQENRRRDVYPAAVSPSPVARKRETAPRQRARLPSLTLPALPWFPLFKALAIFLAVAGVAGVGRAAYQAVGAARVDHAQIVQQLERCFADVDRSRQTTLDHVAVAMLQGRLRAQVHELRLPLRNPATGTLEATLDAAAGCVLTMAESLAVAKSPASEQVLSQKVDEFQGLIAQAKQSTAGG